MRDLNDDDLLEVVEGLGCAELQGLPMHSVPMDNGKGMVRGVLATLRMTRNELCAFVVEASNDIRIPFANRLRTWREEQGEDPGSIPDGNPGP